MHRGVIICCCALFALVVTNALLTLVRLSDRTETTTPTTGVRAADRAEGSYALNPGPWDFGSEGTAYLVCRTDPEHRHVTCGPPDGSFVLQAPAFMVNGERRFYYSTPEERRLGQSVTCTFGPE